MIDLRTADVVLAGSMNPSQPTVMQMPLIDPVTNQRFMSQGNSGVGSSETTWISRMTPGGDLIDWMALDNGGHGTIFDIQRIGSYLYVWCSFATVNPTTGVTTQNNICRIRWTPGHVQKNDSVVEIIDIFTTSYAGVRLDIPNNWMYIRTSAGAAPNNYDNYTRRKLSEVLAGINKTYGVIGPFWLNLDHADGHIMQGFTGVEDKLIRYTGNTDASDPHIIGVYTFPDTGTASLADALEYKINVTAYGRETDGQPLYGFNEPEGISHYRQSNGDLAIMFGKCTGRSGARKYLGYVMSASPIEALSDTVDALLSIAVADTDKTCRSAGNVTSMMDCDQPGWYYLSTDQVADTGHDRPANLQAGGFYLLVSPREGSGVGAVQLLFRNGTASMQVFFRTVNFSSGAKSQWYQYALTPIAYA